MSTTNTYETSKVVTIYPTTSLLDIAGVSQSSNNTGVSSQFSSPTIGMFDH